jgi:hypothetical protein
VQVRIAPTLDSVLEQYHLDPKHVHRRASSLDDEVDEEEDLNSTMARRQGQDHDGDDDADADDADDNSTLASQSVASMRPYNANMRVRVAPTLESVLSQNHRHSQFSSSDLPPRGVHVRPLQPRTQRGSQDDGRRSSLAGNDEDGTRGDENDMEETMTVGSSTVNGFLSTRAVRGQPDSDGGSSLGTSATSATATLTATTRGSTAGTAGTLRVVNVEGGEEIRSHDGTRSSGSNVEMVFSGISNASSPHNSRGVMDGAGRGRIGVGGTSTGSGRAPRSRSQSPLTVQESVAVESVADSSVAPSFVSTAAVAPSRAFSSRRAMAAAQIQAAAANDNSNSISGLTSTAATSSASRPRVVSFVHPNMTSNMMEDGDGAAADDEHEDVMDQDQDNLSALGGADSVVSMPLHLLTLTHVVGGTSAGSASSLDINGFASSAQKWREEYETRLDSIQKQMLSE